MLIEYLADAFEDDRIPLGVGGKPVKKTTYKGEEITLTGSDVFDDLEREWIDQEPRSIGQINAEIDELEDNVNILETLAG